ncbi:MAG: adenosylmethionine--8-amino-7-oxononanoate transaminase [Candidatus Lernaella stagnicola]|nr:adenosylmethionine--8-amino-7-oxononanoate transaminase [Candidatus Lernaella stagnicola]
MSRSTKELRRLDRRHVWHPFTQMSGWQDEDFPVIVGGQGVHLIDSEGRHYLDGVSSLWTNVHGHRVPQIDEALREQLDRIAHSTLLGLGSEASIDFAAALAPHLPGDLERIFYSDNGATAMEVAVKIAFAYWRHIERPEKNIFYCFEEAYHGDTIGSVSVGGIDLFHSLYQPLLFDAPQLPYPFAPLQPKDRDRDAFAEQCWAQIETTLRDQAASAAAVVIEPLMQGAGGMRPAPAGFLRRLRELCDELDILLIVDEVATGFGRTGKLFACDHEGVVPDLMGMAKGISGGYLPLAATAVSEKVYEAFLGPLSAQKTFFHGHTYTGNPLACAAAKANLEILVEQALPIVPERVEALADCLRTCEELPHVAQTRQVGLMAGIELVADPETFEPYPADRRMGHQVTLAARRRGAIIRPLGDVIVLMPPLAMTPAQINELNRVVVDSIVEVTG